MSILTRTETDEMLADARKQVDNAMRIVATILAENTLGIEFYGQERIAQIYLALLEAKSKLP